jgi:hypothetical protein
MVHYAKVPLQGWVEHALADDSRWLGIEFYELSDAPAGRGIELLASSCALLDEARHLIARHGCDTKLVVPYIKFRLSSTAALLDWRPDMWQRVSGEHAAIELVKDGSVFYWGVWESHHLTIRLVERPEYRAIFRQHKGVYESEIWEEYESEILVVAGDA